MPVFTTLTTTIEAPVDLLYSIIVDFNDYPSWAQEITKITVLDDADPPQRVSLTAESSLIKDEYELVYCWDEKNKTVSWELVKSQLQKSQYGRYTFRSLGRQTEVEFAISLQLRVPLISGLRRKIEQKIANTCLRSLRQRAEYLLSQDL